MPPPEEPRRHLDDRNLCNQLVVTGAAAPLVGAGPKPALVFEFKLADGTDLLPILLVLEDPTACATSQVIHEQIHVAKARALAMRSLS